MAKKVCMSCTYCLHDQEKGDYICHNSKSEKYGSYIKDINSCNKFDSDIYMMDMDIMEAIKIVLGQYEGEDDKSHHYYCNYRYKLPDRDQKHAYAILQFEDNEDLQRYKAAQLAMLSYYIDHTYKE